MATCYVMISGTVAGTLPDLLISMPGTLGAVTIGVVNFTITNMAKTTDLVQI